MQMFPLFRIALFALLATASLAGHAVTLGEARVKSFLNQPLDAEIDLIGLDRGQNENLRLRIANQQYFDSLGIAYNHLLADLQFDVVRSGKRWLVRARSTRPITEPFLDFPLQMSWPGGRLIRQYTLLLDPQRPIRPARATQTTRAVTRPTPQAAARTSAPAADTASGSYGPVRRGETLWPIAKKLRPRGITTRQMAMALLRANPQAFINGNINKLRAGSVLDIPPLAFIQELDPRTARAEFAAQMKQQRPAVATSPRTMPPVPAPSATSRDTAQTARVATEQAGDTEDSDAQLRIVTDQEKASTGPGSTRDLNERLLVTMEEIESNRLTTDAIESRVARMEAELDRMRKLVELKDAQISALQSEVRERDEIEAAAQKAEPPAPDSAVQPSVTTAAPIAQTAPPTAVTSIEATSPATAPRQLIRPWYEQHLWLVWVALALLGLAVLLLMFRRPQTVPVGSAPAELPRVPPTAPADVRATPAPGPAEIHSAEEDLRAVAEARMPDTDTASSAGSVELPDVASAQIATGTDELEEGEITDSVLAEMLEESRLAPETAPTGQTEPTFDDEDIASWIKELGSDGDDTGQRSANDEQVSGDDEQAAGNDEIPSILTQLDDQLSTSASAGFPEAPTIQLEPVDDIPDEPPVEDDTFTMSLDLARAYLEIGDQEGAKDMLKQALAGARNPDHRRQIEELLQQIN